MEQLVEKCKTKYMSSKKRKDETNTEYYKRIKQEFLFNVFNSKYYFKGLPIRFKKYVNSKGEVECFYHTITAQDSTGKAARQIDLQRYEKCLLVFVVLDQCTCNHLQCPQLTIKPDYSKDDRISIFCSKYEFVIILEKRNNHYEYITGFPVSNKNINKYY